MAKKNYDIKKIFGENVRSARVNRNLTQERFSELLGIGTSTLSKIECGKSYPHEDTICKIVEVLEIEPHLLFIDNLNIDVETVYKNTVDKLAKMKSNKALLKTAADFISELSLKLD